MFYIFRYVQGIEWNSLPKPYLDQNHFNIDGCIFGNNKKLQNGNEEQRTEVKGPVKVDAEEDYSAFQDSKAADVA